MCMEIKMYESPELEVIKLMAEQSIFSASAGPSTDLEDPELGDEVDW